MTHTYPIQGITCSGCANKVRAALSAVQGVSSVEVAADLSTAFVTMHHHIPTATLSQAVSKAGAYRLGGIVDEPMPPATGGFWSESRLWRRASLNTLSCLIGCSIGDFAMIIYLQAYHPGTSMAVQMALAVVAGLITSVALETVLMRIREKFAWGAALRMAIGMSFLSMVAMEVAMNLTDFMITGGTMALSDPRYWLAFIPAAAAGFVVPLPYNYYQLKKHNKACH
jgi:copper chaperone CopZ